jgi:hypothetical protein
MNIVGKHLSKVSLASASIALMLCACARQDSAGDASGHAADAQTDVALPRPESNGGSVTGMPSKPGPNPVGSALVTADEDLPAYASVAQPAESTASADDSVDADTAAAVANPPPIAMDAEPSAQEAAAVLQDYYAAINERDFQRAWSRWSDGGRSSGQTEQQFADGFAGTAQVALTVGTPGRIDAAAGSRYIDIPVAIQATQRDGTVRRYAGSYTLRRAVVDGATDLQRTWHISSAALHEVP